MHGGIRFWLALMLAALAVCAGPAMAQQLADPALAPGHDGGYAVDAGATFQPPSAPMYGRMVSTSMADEGPGLAAKVEALEKEIAKMKDKEAAAKKKAAGKMSVKAGGRIMLDYALFGQGAGSRGEYGDVQDGCEFRRARLFLSGEGFDVISYKIQFDFADTDEGFLEKTIQSTAFKDVFMAVHHLPIIGNVKVGHFKECFGLEQLTSSKYITFMERSLGDEGAFVPGRRVGVMAYDNWAGENGTWAIGAFRNELTNGAEPPFRKDDDGGTAMTMRATFLPWYDEATEGRGLIHTGIAYSYRNVDDGTYRLRARPEAHLAPYVVNTGNVTNVPEVQLLGLELAAVYGPLSFQTEYFSEWIPRTGGNGTAYLNGYYAYVSYFLTGENRKYDREDGAFGRVKPFTNFFRVRTSDGIQTGWGAWEIAYRYSHIDLYDASAGVNGGLADDHTVGLNWYLNPYTRLMWNYVHSAATPSVGNNPITNMNIYEMRCQIDF